ncbi:hypothetical protein JCM3765_005895 [Sporobolomyces pararoseus]
MKPALLQLPNETLARIAHLCKEQDRRTKARLDNLGEDGDNEELIGPWEKLKPSLHALSKSCQKLRDVCIPLIFTTIDLEGAADPLFFRRIAPKYALNFDTVELVCSADDDTDDIHEALLVSSGLKGIRNVIIGGDFLSEISLGSRTNFATWLLSNDEVATRTLSSLLTSTSGLRSLTLAGTPYGSESSHAQLFQQICSLTSLDELDLQGDWLPLLSASTVQPTTPIHSLVLRKESALDRHNIEFISHFASTLRSLEIEAFGEIDKLPGSLPLFTTKFPNLHFIHLNNTATPLLSSSPSLLPSLQTLRITLVDQTIDDLIPHLQNFSRQLAALKTVEIGPDGLVDRRLARYTRHQFLKNSFKHRESDFEDYYEGRSILLDDFKKVQEEEEENAAEKYIRWMSRPLRDVLKFGLELEEAVAKSGDVQKMEKLVQAARPLLMLKEFEED